MTRFSDKVVAVTGAGSGIGQASAVLFAAEGAIVGVNDIIPERANETVAQINGDGGRAHAYPGDVTVPGFIDDLLADLVKSHGKLDVVHNNAGFGRSRSAVCDIDDTDWAFDIDLNLTAILRGIRAALRIMQPQRHGAIINTSSGAGVRAVPHTAPYGAAKAGIIQLTRSAAIEAAPYGVSVNSISPGAVFTPVFATYLSDPAALAAYEAQIPARRMAQPRDVAEVVAFLASPAAAYVTGVDIPIDGGTAAIMPAPMPVGVG